MCDTFKEDKNEKHVNFYWQLDMYSVCDSCFVFYWKNIFMGEEVKMFLLCKKGRV